jgi:hypothetical protein
MLLFGCGCVTHFMRYIFAQHFSQKLRSANIQQKIQHPTESATRSEAMPGYILFLVSF